MIVPSAACDWRSWQTIRRAPSLSAA